MPASFCDLVIGVFGLDVLVRDVPRDPSSQTDIVLVNRDGLWEVSKVTIDARGYDGLNHPAIVVDLQEFSPRGC